MKKYGKKYGTKYGKLLLSAYIMKKMKSGGSLRSRGIVSKYAKLALGAYLLKKLKSEKPEKEVEVETEPEEKMISGKPVEVEAGTGSSMKLAKIVLCVLAGAAIVYTIKKQVAKKREYKIEVE